MRVMSWAAALVAALGLLSPTAQANTVDVFEGATQIGSLTDGLGSVTFLGYTAPLTTSFVQANTVSLNPSPQNLVPKANQYFGTAFTVADDSRTPGSGAGMVFDVSSTYFSISFGGQVTAFFQNTSGGLLHLTYTTVPGEGAGLSHFDQFTASAVPGPIVGAGLPGLMMALGGLVILARRRRHQSAPGLDI